MGKVIIIMALIGLASCSRYSFRNPVVVSYSKHVGHIPSLSK
jgi:hypothetical protein